MKRLKYFLLKSLIVIMAFLLSSVSRADLSTDIETLLHRYQDDFEKAGQRGPLSNSAFRLGFSVDDVPAHETAGMILRAISVQEKALEQLNQDPNPSVAVRPGNDLKTNGGLLFIETNIARDCRHCKTLADRIAYAKAAHALIEIFDIQAAGARSPRSRVKFSGLPFFDLVADRFANPVFQKRAIAFHDELAKLVGEFSVNPNYDLKTNAYEIAVKVCAGDKEAATELAGLLLARDSNVIKYFSFIPRTNQEFVRKVSMTPLLTRLIATLDRVSSNQRYDRFSFDGQYAVGDARNYYFWSGALVAEQLRSRGVSEDAITELNLQFARHYKILRWYEDQARRVIDALAGKGLAPWNQKDHDVHSFRTMRITGAGNRLSAKNACKFAADARGEK